MEKQREKIRKFSKIVHILIKIVFVVAIVLCAFDVLTWIVAEYHLPYLFVAGDTKVMLPVAIMDNAGFETSPGLVRIPFINIIRDVVTIIGLGYARKVFRLLRDDGSPFREEIVRGFRNLAIVLLCLGFVTGIAGFIGAGIVGVLCFIFDYGCSLQRESDTTL